MKNKIRKYYPPNFGGWPAHTLEDPKKVLWTIWSAARMDYTGLRGFLDTTEDVLEFSGIRIRIKDEPFSLEAGHTLAIEITDKEKIQPEFLDLWLYFKTSPSASRVFGGPGEEDRGFFSGDAAKLAELDFYVNLFYNERPIKRGMDYNRDEWLSQNAPSWITYQMLQNRAREREQKNGEVFKYRVKRGKKKNV
ncbi:MAG: hypothetical protein ACOYYU_10360 [Chloroflexota bacterium]